MNEALELSKPLHERIYERIRDSIGDLMTDEDLKVLVNKAAEKAFFEPVPQKDYRGYGAAPTTPPVLVEEIRKLLSADMRECVLTYMSENKKEVQELIDHYLAENFAKMLSATLNSLMQQPLDNMRSAVVSQFRLQ